MSSTPSEALRLAFAQAHKRLRDTARVRALEDLSVVAAAEPVPLVDFSSNDYLGLRRDPRIAAGGFDAVRAFGSGSGASRLVHAADGSLFALEHSVAMHMGSLEGVLFFASGFQANLAFFDALAPFDFESEMSRGCIELFLDARSHASLHFGARASGLRTHPFRHGDHAQLERLLAKCVATHKIVVVESLHSMDGDFEDLESLLTVCARQGALAFVDEAHTFGVVGPRGFGAVAALPAALRAHVLAVMLGCGKAVGVSGGFLVGPAWLRERVVQKARPLLYSTAHSPFVNGAVQAALNIVFSEEGNDRRALLFKNARSLRECLASRGRLMGEVGSPILSLLVGRDDEALALSARLRTGGVLARAIRPPTVPRGTSRVRLVCQATHSPLDHETLCKALRT
ncbi:MAG: aminotransferase class I/II-fold pyridoxal phosphate-dependent enzyme [Silvanigrellales bacterium]|nr:aminotransferase class I/II-fold pyridoxal phosphate-dependent enzyme [Silvanigrellales bacterium]